MSDWHEFKGKYPQPGDGIRAAVNAATDLAIADMESGVLRHLVYGGPAAPWSGVVNDRRRNLGISIEAVAACEIVNALNLYADVYNVLTAMQTVAWSCYPKSSILSICGCDSPKEQATYDRLLECYLFSLAENKT